MSYYKNNKNLNIIRCCTSEPHQKRNIQVLSKNTKAAFFDRDGVINIDYHYVGKIEELEFVKDVFSALQYVQSKEYDIFIITNQSGVARGFYKETDVQMLHTHMDDKFKEQGIEINGYLYCPHHVDATIAEYSKDCNWRKPNPGMIEAVFSLKQYDKNECFLIGDRCSDILAAKNAGIRGEKFVGGSLLSFVKEKL